MKNMLNAISEFSQKMSRLEKERVPSKIENQYKKLEELIKLSEDERKLKIKNSYDEFFCPVSKEIEEDEEELLAAFEVFEKLASINGNNSGVKVEYLGIRTNFLRKKEYVYDVKFFYLRFWFLKNKKCEYLPVIVESKTGLYVDFVLRDEFKFSYMEKEILQEIDTY